LTTLLKLSGLSTVAPVLALYVDSAFCNGVTPDAAPPNGSDVMVSVDFGVPL
jgi:hypothetical protein